MTIFKTLVMPSLLLLTLFYCKSTPKKEELPPEPPAPVVIPEPVVRAAPEVKDEEMEVAVRPSLNLRDKSGVHGAIIGRIPYGATLVVIDRFDDEPSEKRSRSKWYKVKYDGETGYVNAKYLRETGDDRVVMAPRRVKRRKRQRVAAKKAATVKPEAIEPTKKKKS